MNENNTSRRAFLKNASALTAAASIASLPAEVHARKKSKVDRVRQIDLGARPVIASCGGVLIKTSRLMFLTFDAEKHGEGGVEYGTAMVQLKECLEYKFRGGVLDSLQDHSVAVDQLDACETFEIKNSTWVRRLDPPKRKRKSRYRHLVFTFLGANDLLTGAVHFECVAKGVNLELIQAGSYDELVAYANALDSVDSGRASRRS